MQNLHPDRQSLVIDQSILTNFIIEGHFLRHLRRMKLIYKKTKGELINLLLQHFGADIRISAENAGMHIIVWFLTDKIAPDITLKAKERGIMLYAVDALAIKFKFPTAFMIGFNGFKRSMLEESVIALKTMITE